MHGRVSSQVISVGNGQNRAKGKVGLNGCFHWPKSITTSWSAVPLPGSSLFMEPELVLGCDGHARVTLFDYISTAAPGDEPSPMLRHTPVPLGVRSDHIGEAGQEVLTRGGSHTFSTRKTTEGRDTTNSWNLCNDRGPPPIKQCSQQL